MLAGLDFIAISTRAGDFYEHAGWYLPLHPALLRYVVEHPERHAPFDARRAAALVGPGSEHWAWITEGLLASPAIESRRGPIEDALFALEHERWHAAICTILPVLEGIISDRSGVLDKMRVGRRFRQILHQDGGHLETLSAVPALAVLESEVFRREQFARVAISHDSLNRHLILHGRTVGSGNELSAIRSLMLLIALVELLDGPLLLRSAIVLVDGGSLLDEYGPLAVIRLGALGRPAPPERLARAVAGLGGRPTTATGGG